MKEIEVESKFQPTEEQLADLLKDAEFISGKDLVDNYYDTESYVFVKNSMLLRNRGGSWELKVYDTSISDSSSVANEITQEKEILKKLGYDSYQDIDGLAKKKLQLWAPILTKRKSYQKEGFVIACDETDFGLSQVEIELTVNKESEVEDAKRRIADFAQQFGLKEANLKVKPIEYLERMKPEVYREIYGNNEFSKELKMK